MIVFVSRAALALALVPLAGRLARADEPAAAPIAVETSPAPQALGDLASTSSWQPPAPASVRAQLAIWAAKQSDPEKAQTELEANWPTGATEAGQGALAGEAALDRLVKTLSAIDPKVREVVEFTQKPRSGLVPPKFEVLQDEKVDPLVRNNLRLWYARWLARERLYDESQQQLSDLNPADVVDPASLLFYRAVAQHWFLDRPAGLDTLATLLQGEAYLPRRYETVAKLMKSDLEALKDDSLDHISRRMDDVKRRLDFGRTGKTVRSVEDGVIASLDKLIEEMEKQQQQQEEASSSSSKKAAAPVRPAEESRPMAGKGPGEVTSKRIGDQSGWGDLPPKQREEAIQQIGEEFPSHYREVIEQYFRKLASEEEEK